MMRLTDWIGREPARVAFGRRGGGGAAAVTALSATPDGDSVLVTPEPGGTPADLLGATQASAGVMTAADKAKLDGLPDGGSLNPAEIATRTAIAGAVIDGAIGHLRTAGHGTAGDGGAALWRRVGAEPDHPGKEQSADGAWWEIVPEGGLNPLQFGAAADGSDDRVAMADACAAAVALAAVLVLPGGRSFYLGGTVQVSGQVPGPARLHIRAEPGARVHGTAYTGGSQHDLFNLTDLMELRVEGGRYDTARSCFEIKDTAAPLEGVRISIEGAQFLDFQFGLEIDDDGAALDPASFIERCVIRGCRFSARADHVANGGTAQTAFDILQEAGAMPIRQFEFAGNHGQDGGARSVVLNQRLNGHHVFHANRWQDYVNEETTDPDPDAQFILVEGGTVAISDNYARNLAIISPAVTAQDQEAVRLGPVRQAQFSNNIWIDAGGNEAVLNLKDAQDVHVDGDYIQFTAAYNAAQQASAADDPHTAAIMLPHDNFTFTTITVENCTGPALEWDSSREGVAVAGGKLVLIDCATGESGYLSGAAVHVVGGNTTPHSLDFDVIVQTSRPRRALADLATTGPITLSGEQTIDATLTSASRVLVWQQADATENGVYLSAPGAWSRATDMDAETDFHEVVIGVAGGATQAGAVFKSYDIYPVPGTDAISFHRVDTRVPSRMFQFQGHTSRVRLGGHWAWSGLLALFETNGYGDVTLEGDMDWSRATRGPETDGAPGELRLTWRGRSINHAGVAYEHKLADGVCFAESIHLDGMRWEFTDVALHNTRQFGFHHKTHSAWDIAVSGVFARHSVSGSAIAEQCSIAYRYVSRADGAGVVTNMAAPVETVIQGGTGFAPGGSTTGANPVQLRPLDLVGDTGDAVRGFMVIDAMYTRHAG